MSGAAGWWELALGLLGLVGGGRRLDELVDQQESVATDQFEVETMHGRDEGSQVAETIFTHRCEQCSVVAHAVVHEKALSLSGDLQGIALICPGEMVSQLDVGFGSVVFECQMGHGASLWVILAFLQGYGCIKA